MDILYCIKAGWNDNIVSRACKTVVHSVFQFFEPHGDVYAYISDWLSTKMSGGAVPNVPHMIHLSRTSSDLRTELGIPKEAVVFGRSGGEETFDIPFVHTAVYDIAKHNLDRYFIFLNTHSFCAPLPNIIHLHGTADLVRKTAFINSCDAMLHARQSGETFGLAVAEFSSRNKPIITWAP